MTDLISKRQSALRGSVPASGSHYRSVLSLFLIFFTQFSPAWADINSARSEMEDQSNPLLQMRTSQGEIYIELFALEAPSNIQHFLALVNGDQATTPLLPPDSAQTPLPTTDQGNRSYFDGSYFHRVIPGFLIQAGSPYHNTAGRSTRSERDEINAQALGLDSKLAITGNGEFHEQLNIKTNADFTREILIPLYRKMGLRSNAEVKSQEFAIKDSLERLSIEEVYANQGIRFTRSHPTRAITPGIVALANSGPDSNGSEFFISLDPNGFGLTGKYTVIGQVIEGMDVVINISQQAVAADQVANWATTIESVIQVN